EIKVGRAEAWPSLCTALMPGDRTFSSERRRHSMRSDRRGFLLSTTAFGVAAVGSMAIPVRVGGKEMDDQKKEEAEEEISAPEDLMREHGVLNRILLIYEEGLRRLRAKDDVPPEVFHKPATLVRMFVEDYHEKLEEKFIFPPFEEQKKLVELV